jgi:hypothetical protein
LLRMANRHGLVAGATGTGRATAFFRRSDCGCPLRATRRLSEASTSTTTRRPSAQKASQPST